jgi:hypothetical protein
MKKKENYFVLLPLIFLCSVWFLSNCATTKISSPPPKPYKDYLTHIHPDLMVKPDEAYQWHLDKDKGGPTYSGSASWKRMMTFVESRLRQYGVVDLTKNSWTYDRWVTSEWPDDTNWTLMSNGEKVKVASYGAYSGSTDARGVTAELVYYDPAAPPSSIKGKIAVFATAPHPAPPLTEDYKRWFTSNDYEYLSDPDTLPPRFTQVSVNTSVSYDVWWQLRQTIRINGILTKGQAAGGIVVFNMSYDRLAGLYTFPIPVLYNVPTLYLDKKVGAKVIGDARQGRSATLKLLAKVEPTDTYQLIGYLPGKNYGKADDEKILLVTHTDGPCLSQDNGPFGILSIVAYFSHIPQAERPRTLMIFMDNRHYMPGMEAAFEKQDWFTRYPETKKSIVALVATEHLGQIEYKEEGDVFAPTGMVEPSFLWARNNPLLINMAIRAAKDHQWPRCMVQCVEKPGIHGGSQGVWYGMGKIALDWNIPGFGMMGTQGAYWATTGRINKFHKDLFCKEVAAMAQLTGELMLADLGQIKPSPPQK